MVSALDSGTSCAPGLSPEWPGTLCCQYSWARHLTLTVPLSNKVYKWVQVNLMLGVTLRWTSIPSWLLYATENGISSGLGHLAHMQT